MYCITFANFSYETPAGGYNTYTMLYYVSVRGATRAKPAGGWGSFETSPY